MDLDAAVLTDHAKEQMSRRKIDEADVRQILAAPEETAVVREGRIVAQGMIGDQLLRIFVDVDRTPPEVVTAYRTSKIDRYRSRP